MVPEILAYEPEKLAENIARSLDYWVREQGRFSLGLPGGRSPGELLGLIGRKLHPETREDLGLFWVDERWVPKGHTDRNDGQIIEAWRAGGQLPSNVFPMPGSDEYVNPEDGAHEYTKALEKWKPGPLDLAILGLGEDGHVASLFPHHPGLMETAPVFVCNNSPKSPETRLSLSLPYLRQSRAIVVLVLGAQKGRALAEALEFPGAQRPVSLLFTLPSPSVKCYLDSAALEQLPGDFRPKS
ncbi:MAG: 6-phosphogluconolactonase [Spirochaetales bacterium]|nr:6-phosphogluconolactonase [Spirochaetales bacterium]